MHRIATLIPAALAALALSACSGDSTGPGETPAAPAYTITVQAGASAVVTSGSEVTGSVSLTTGRETPAVFTVRRADGSPVRGLLPKVEIVNAVIAAARDVVSATDGTASATLFGISVGTTSAAVSLVDDRGAVVWRGPNLPLVVSDARPAVAAGTYAVCGLSFVPNNTILPPARSIGGRSATGISLQLAYPRATLAYTEASTGTARTVEGTARAESDGSVSVSLPASSLLIAPVLRLTVSPGAETAITSDLFTLSRETYAQAAGISTAALQPTIEGRTAGTLSGACPAPAPVLATVPLGGFVGDAETVVRVHFLRPAGEGRAEIMLTHSPDRAEGGTLAVGESFILRPWRATLVSLTSASAVVRVENMGWGA